MGRVGFAPNFVKAVKAGTINDVEYSEWTMLQGIRAAADGLPFLPTRAGGDSDVVAALNYESVVDPYTGASYLAVPPLRPDVAVIHAWRASPNGDVQFGWPPEHLWDVDVLAARAARFVIVTVDEIVSAGRDRAAQRADATVRLRGRPARPRSPVAPGPRPARRSLARITTRCTPTCDPAATRRPCWRARRVEHRGLRR